MRLVALSWKWWSSITSLSRHTNKFKMKHKHKMLNKWRLERLAASWTTRIVAQQTNLSQQSGRRWTRLKWICLLYRCLAFWYAEARLRRRLVFFSTQWLVPLKRRIPSSAGATPYLWKLLNFSLPLAKSSLKNTCCFPKESLQSATQWTVVIKTGTKIILKSSTKTSIQFLTSSLTN